MGKDKSGDYNPDYFADWKDIDHICGCGTEHYFSECVKRVEVPMCADGRRVAVNTGRTFLGILTLGLSEIVAGCPGDLTHEAIEILYKCSECGKKFFKTYEIWNADQGKFYRWGYYDRQFTPRKSWPGCKSHAFFDNIFDGMWSHSYNRCYKNCKDWCKKFWEDFERMR